MNIALYSGSFNPIHNGHVALCRYLCRERPAGIDALHILLTPRTPLKPDLRMAPDAMRMQMCALACRDIPLAVPDDFETHLPPPHYTIATLQALREAYPQHNFRLVIGADNWLSFSSWRAPQQIIDQFGLIIYPRPGYLIPQDTSFPPNVVYLPGAPMTDISSTYIRARAAAGQSITGLVPRDVEQFILHNNLYR